MAFSFKKFWKGITLAPKSVSTADSMGDLEVIDTDGKLRYNNGVSTSSVVTENHTATLINKTISADDNSISELEVDNLKVGVLNTDLSVPTPTDTQIPSALAVQTYVDNSSGSVKADVDDLITLSGVPANSTDLGIFTGSVIADNSTVKYALQSLETFADMDAFNLASHITNPTGAHEASAISVVPSGNLTSTEVQSALEELQTDVDDINSAGYVVGPALVSDNSIARFDGTTGKLIQGSSVTIEDDGTLTSGAIATISSVQIASGAVTGTGGSLILQSNGVGNVYSYADFNPIKKFKLQVVADSSTGANVTLASVIGGCLRLTNSGLTSIDMIDATSSNGQVLIIENKTGNAITINNETGATAANRIVTGTGAPLNLANDASIQLFYDGGAVSRWQIIGGTGAGGGQSLDTIFQLTGSDFSQWVSGNNATFLGGGTLQGVFASETASPLNGISSYKYTQTASPGSLNDYIASPIQEVPLRFRGQTNTVVFPFSYNGSNDDIVPVMYDVTNSAIIFGSVNNDGYALPGTNGGVKNYQANFIIPLSCTQVRFGFQVKVFSASAVLQFDDVEVSNDLTAFAKLDNNTNWESYTPTFQGFGTPTSVDMKWRRVGDSIEIQGRFVAGTVSGSEARVSLPLGYVTKSTVASLVTVGRGVISDLAASDRSVFIEPSVSYLTFGITSIPGANPSIKGIGSEVVSSSGTFIFNATSIPIQGWSATSDNIITPTESFSTDTAQLTYANAATYTLTTLPNAPVGTYITFTYAAGTNIRTQTTGSGAGNLRPTQTDADMNINGIRLYTRAYGAASTGELPVVIAIQIGKGLKGKNLELYKSVGKVTAGSLDLALTNPGATDLHGLSYKDYNEVTGILHVDAGYCLNGGITTRGFAFSDITLQSNGYLVINASKSPALTGVPALIPRIAYIKDIRSSGTNGGTLTSGSYNTRVLNTLDDPTGIVTSLSSNQFTLPPGQYDLDCTAPVSSYVATVIGLNKSIIYNVTDSATAILGESQIAQSQGSSTILIQSSGSVKGTITITSSKTFELRTRVGTTGSGASGAGAACSFGDNEVYSVVKITKIK